MSAMVQLTAVSKSFGPVVALKDVTLTIEPGAVFGLLGHNGAGKTTLIRTLTGLFSPDTGSVEVFGLDPMRDGHEVRRRSGVLTTYPGIDDYLSPRENLEVYAAIQGLPRDEATRQSWRLLSHLGINPRSTEPARSLSAGQKQRVALARALVHDPDLLLLDEPTANLDPMAARGVRRLVRDLASEGRTVIFTTHNLAEAEDLCDEVGILREGRLLTVGAVPELAGNLTSEIRLEVSPHDTARTLEILQPLLNGHPLDVHGGTICIGAAGSQDVPVVVRSLVEANIDVLGATQRSPSLEDVYLSLHTPGANL